MGCGGLCVPMTPVKRRALHDPEDRFHNSPSNGGDHLKQGINRRAFLKTAALASASVATLPTLSSLVPPVLGARGDVGFHFVSTSKAATVGTVEHRVMMTGDGKYNQLTTEFKGGGNFVHFDNAGPGDPKPILGAGDWRPTRLANLNIIGTWGKFAAGVFEMDVQLLQNFPSKALIPASLKIICNLGCGKLSTGQGEGTTLNIPQASFGPFTPLPYKKRKGLTILTTTPI